MFPLVLVPNAFGLTLVAGHDKRLNASLSLRAKSFAVATALWAVFQALPQTAHRAVAMAYALLRAPFSIATVRMRHRCHGLSRDVTSPESLRLVRSIEIFPDAFLKVAPKADRTRYCTELNSPLSRAGVRDEKGDAPARQN